MFDSDGNIKLIDFGFAVNPINKHKCQLDRVGTPYYVAPEVFTGEYGYKWDGIKRRKRNSYRKTINLTTKMADILRLKNTPRRQPNT